MHTQDPQGRRQPGWQMVYCWLSMVRILGSCPTADSGVVCWDRARTLRSERPSLERVAARRRRYPGRPRAGASSPPCSPGRRGRAEISGATPLPDRTNIAAKPCRRRIIVSCPCCLPIVPRSERHGGDTRTLPRSERCQPQHLATASLHARGCVDVRFQLPANVYCLRRATREMR